jgi:hypothetical protein
VLLVALGEGAAHVGIPAHPLLVRALAVSMPIACAWLWFRPAARPTARASGRTPISERTRSAAAAVHVPARSTAALVIVHGNDRRLCGWSVEPATATAARAWSFF